MANKPLKTIKFPGLDDTYTVPQVDAALATSGAAADAKKVGDELSDLKQELNQCVNLLIDSQSGLNSNSGLLLLPTKKNDSITVKRTDGQPFSQDDQLRFYNADGTYIDYWGVSSAYGYQRTFTYNSNTPALYVGLTKVGSNVIDYDVTNNTAKRITSQIKEIKNNERQYSRSMWCVDVDKGGSVNTIGKLTPFYAKKGDSITAISADRNQFVDDQLRFFDINGNLIEYWALASAYGNCRNFIYDKTTDAYYVGVATASLIDPSLYIVTNNSNAYKTDGGIIVVDANGNGDYTSLTQALYENVDNGIKIVVKPGTYDIVSEYVALFGQTAVDNMADSDSSTFNGFQYGAIIRNRKIEFAPGAHVVCDWTGHTVDGTHRFSALRVDYNAEIIGLDLDVTATFYGVHDDYGIDTPYFVKYENCRVVGHGIVNADCIGGGCKKYSRHILKNCYFDNNLTDSATVRYHNTNAEGAEPEIYVSNCYFNNWFTPRWYGTQTTKMRVYVNNCEARSIHKLAESSSYNVDNVELYKWCNTETNPVT